MINKNPLKVNTSNEMAKSGWRPAVLQFRTTPLRQADFTNQLITTNFAVS